MADYTIDIRSLDGTARIAYFDNDGIVDLDYVLTENSPHALSLTFMANTLNASALVPDTRIYVYRRANLLSGYALQAQTCFLVEDIERTPDYVKLTAAGAMKALSRRIVNYPAGSTQSSKYDYADEIMRQVLVENFGSSAIGTARKVASTLLSIPNQNLVSGAVVSSFPKLRKAFAWDNVLSVFQEIANTCNTLGTYMSFDIVAQNESLLAFRTWAGSRGGDKRPGKTTSLVLSEQNGTLANTKVALLHSDYANYVRAAGQGEGEARALAEAIDTARAISSPWGRREVFHNASNSDEVEGLQAEADARLWESRPRLTFEADIAETDDFQYDKDFTLGTLLSANMLDITFDCRVSSVHCHLGQDGNDTVEVKVSGETAI